MDVDLVVDLFAISKLIISPPPKIILEPCTLLYFFVLQSLQIFAFFCYSVVSIPQTEKRLHVKIVIILYKCDFLSIISEQAKREIPGAGPAVMQGFCAAIEAFSSRLSLKRNFIEMAGVVIGVVSLARSQLAVQGTTISKGPSPGQPVPRHCQQI